MSSVIPGRMVVQSFDNDRADFTTIFTRGRLALLLSFVSTGIEFPALITTNRFGSHAILGGRPFFQMVGDRTAAVSAIRGEPTRS